MIIKNIEYEFFSYHYWAFSKMLSGPNYFPFIRSTLFSYSENTDITINDLKTLLPSMQDLYGTITPATYEDLINKTLEYFTWTVSHDGIITKTLDTELTHSKNLIFWSLVESHVTAPLERCFIYFPEKDSYFIDTTLWRFCFIILGGGNGVVVYGKTWKDARDCIPENDSEKCWRKTYGML